MLQITVPATELWDDSKQEFITTKEQILTLEHSLISLSKWESKWCKFFFSKQGGNHNKTYEETVDYIRCMTLTRNVDPNVYYALTKENIAEINKYIEAPMTATTFSKNQKGKQSGEQITSELIYYWMVSLGIPVEFEKWHINRLLTFIRVCEIKNQPAKKMNKNESMSRYAAINAARRQKLNSKG